VLKLLLIAPTCDGGDVGEAWNSYQWARHLADRYEVTLLTYHKRGRNPASKQLSGMQVIEWSEPPGIGRAERLNSMLKPGYLPFYISARRWIRRARSQGIHFDVAHQAAPVALRYPSPVAGLGIPFTIGPVGGSLSSPPGFGTADDTAPWYVGLRRLDNFRIRHDQFLRHTYEQAGCVLGIAPYVQDFLSGLTLRRFEVMSEVGIESIPPPVNRTDRPAREVRLLFVGRLIRTKGARDAISALEIVRDLPIVMDVVGDGFDRNACEKLAADLGLADRVRFHGRVSRDVVDSFYRSADIFVFPSYREPGGGVVFEAMSYGLPLIVCDRGGPGHMVDQSCGLKLRAISPGQYARDLAHAIRLLVGDPALRLSLGAGARKRAEKVAMWDRKVGRLEAIHVEMLNRQHNEAGAMAGGRSQDT
jgi:glycosyltransferase involved in cell wall biosynthesis